MNDSYFQNIGDKLAWENIGNESANQTEKAKDGWCYLSKIKSLFSIYYRSLCTRV